MSFLEMAIYEEPFWQYSSSMAAPQIPWEPHGSVPDGAAQFLAAGRVAHLALLDGNPPIAVPFRYHFDPAQPGRLYLHGPAASLALRLAASGARASVTVLLLDGVVGVMTSRLNRLRKKFVCHSERSEESLCALDLNRRETLRFAQNDTKTEFFRSL